jgi:hypothetical protein
VNAGDRCTDDFFCDGGECEFGACLDFGTCDFCDPDLVNDGCVGVDLTAPFPLDRIATGTGAIAQLTYLVDPVTIPLDNYADLNPQAIDVQDSASLPLSVSPISGKINLVDLADLCEGDFPVDGNVGDGDVDATDLTTFLVDFGRGGYDRPCINGNLCNGDFACDGDVDATDLTMFLEDFGRGFYNRPCPLVPLGTCLY